MSVVTTTLAKIGEQLARGLRSARGSFEHRAEACTISFRTASVKYCLMQTFMVPVRGVGGLVDSDEENHDGVKPRAKPIDLSGVTNPWEPTKDALKAKLMAATSTDAIDDLRASHEWTDLVKGVGVPAGWPDALIDLARKRWRELAA